MSEVTVGENSVLEYAIVDENTEIGANVRLGEEKSAGKGIAVVGRELTVGDGAVIGGGEMIEKTWRRRGNDMKALGIVFSNIHDANLPELVRLRTLASIPFGGRYRLIDFALSNMVNSGITKVGVITKRNYQSLMDHVGSGKDWDLARKDGGLIILPPFGDRGSDTLYNSRLEALKSITGFLRHADEDYVVMTDCDNVCRINYNDVIEYHRISKADITLVYRKNAMEEDNAVTLSVGSDGRVSALKYESKAEAENNVFANIYVMKRSCCRISSWIRSPPITDISRPTF